MSAENDPEPTSEQDQPGEEVGAGSADPVEPDASDGVEAVPELEQLREERDRYLAVAQRAQADLENFRKRTARDAADAERRGRGGLARQLAPSLDNLERALLAAGVEPDAGTGNGDEPISEEVTALRALAEGIALVYRELRTTLERAGIVVFDPTGERFDPGLHEAISTRAEEGVAPGQVVETLDRGLRLDDQVLRAAKVIVSE